MSYGTGSGSGASSSNKRFNTEDLEHKVHELSKKCKIQERELKLTQLDLSKAKEQYEKKKKFDSFIDMMENGTCVICSENLYDCVGEDGMAFASYKCRCSKQQMVHLGCWTRKFRCACGTHATIKVKNHEGNDVHVTVGEIENVESEDDEDAQNPYVFGSDTDSD